MAVDGMETLRALGAIACSLLMVWGSVSCAAGQTAGSSVEQARALVCVVVGYAGLVTIEPAVRSLSWMGLGFTVMLVLVAGLSIPHIVRGLRNGVRQRRRRKRQHER